MNRYNEIVRVNNIEVEANKKYQLLVPTYLYLHVD